MNVLCGANCDEIGRLNSARKVLGLYLKRPWECLCCAGVCGRFGYSDLKEAALSGAAALWELNGVESLLLGWVDVVWVRTGRTRDEFEAADEPCPKPDFSGSSRTPIFTR